MTMKIILELKRFISFIASIPFIPGIWISIKAISGLKLSASSMTDLPVFADSISQSPSKFLSIMNFSESITIPSSSASMILYIFLSIFLYRYGEASIVSVVFPGKGDMYPYGSTPVLPLAYYFQYIPYVIKKPEP